MTLRVSLFRFTCFYIFYFPLCVWVKILEGSTTWEIITKPRTAPFLQLVDHITLSYIQRSIFRWRRQLEMKMIVEEHLSMFDTTNTKEPKDY